MMPQTKILILGGGFGGMYAALRLEKTLARDADIEVTIVSRDNFFLFTPMLHEVAASDLDVTDIVTPLRAMFRRVKFFAGEVESIDLRSKRVTVSHGYEPHNHDLHYDYLLIALGSTTNLFKLPGVEERAMTMKTLGDAIQLRNLVISHMEEAETECSLGGSEALMTFVVAGGGFAGIETIGAVNDFVRDSSKRYPHISPRSIRMVVVHPGDMILPELGTGLGKYAQSKLMARGIEIRTNTRMVEATAQGVTLTDGSFVPCRTLIWTAGTSPHPVVGGLPCDRDRGRICVNEYLEVGKRPGVWAVGDCAAISDKLSGSLYPPTAQHALREGRLAADNIAAAIRGGMKQSFAFKSLGQLAAIGHRTGVAKVFGIMFSGFIAWWLWRTIYLSKLPTLEKKVRVALDWTLDLLFPKDLVQFLTVKS
jgi:NADH:ubiquinone reductase (H+-translocating)